jgi:hypothetical protein
VTTRQMRADAFVPNDHNTPLPPDTSTTFVAGSTVCHRGHDKVTLRQGRCSKLERRLVSHVCREDSRLYPRGAHHEPEKRR